MNKKHIRRIHLSKPLMIGVSISSLALAACNSDEPVSNCKAISTPQSDEVKKPVKTKDEINPSKKRN